MSIRAARVAVAFLAVAIALLGSSPVAAAPVVDQQQPIIDDTIGGLAIGGASDEYLAQTFTVGLAGLLVEVGLPIACDSASDLILEIQGVAPTGEPDGTVLRSQTFSGAGLPSFSPGPPFLRPFVLPVPLAVAVGQELAIVLYSPPSGTGCGIFQGPLGDPYPGGDAWFDALPNLPRGWLPLTAGLLPADQRFDLPFETLVDDRLDVDIDFKPRDRHNRINPRRGGPVSVAVLTSPSFDATTVDWTTAELGVGAAPALGPGRTVDVDRDGDDDLVLRFRARETGIACGDTSITLLASTVGGLDIRGVDAIRTIGCRRP